jgi:predicted hydrocarbon binding protein
LEKKQVDVNKEKLGFFVVPSEFMRGIRHELESMVGEGAGKEFLFRSGFRCGESMVKSLGLNNYKMPETLISLWAQTGFGRLKVVEMSVEHIEVQCEESTEAIAIGPTKGTVCDFTRGCLAGTISAIIGKDYYAVEKRCISVGDPHCVFTLAIDERWSPYWR